MQGPGPEDSELQDVRWMQEKIAYLQEQLSAKPSQPQPQVADVLSQLCAPAGSAPVAAVLSQLCAPAGSADHDPSFGGAAPAITVWQVPFQQEGGGDAGASAAAPQRAAQVKQEQGGDAGKSAAFFPLHGGDSQDQVSQDQAVAGLLSLAQSLSRKRPASDLQAGNTLSCGGPALQGPHPALGHANLGQGPGNEKKHRPVYTPEQIRLLTEGYNNGHSKPKCNPDKRFLTPTQREALAAQTGLTLAQVDTWLHNRRKNR